MWEKCIGCGEALFAGDSFCGNCGRPARPATTTVPAAREPEGTGAGRAAAGAAEPGPGLIRIRSAPGVPAVPPAPAAGSADTPAAAGGARPGQPGQPTQAGEPRQTARPGQPGQPEAGSGASQPASGAGRTRLPGQAIADPVRNTRYLRQVLVHAATFAGIYVLVELTLLTLLLLLGAADIGFSVAVKLELGSLAPVAVVLVIRFGLTPVPALLGQWTLLVEGMAEASQLVFGDIQAAFGAHQVPLDGLGPLTLAPPGQATREYIELRQGRFVGYLSCFPHGRDLYVGWTFWVRMSPGRLTTMIIGRTMRSAVGRDDDIHRELSLEGTRALVAAMHSAALAGIGTASAAAGPGGPAAHPERTGGATLGLG